MDSIVNFRFLAFVCLMVLATASPATASRTWDEARLAECRKAIKSGKGKQSLSKLERLSRSRTASVAREAAYLFANISLSQNPPVDVKKAEEHLTALSKPAVKDRWRTRAAILLATHWSSTGRHDAAVRHLDLILAENAQDVDAVRIAIALGDLHASKQKLKESRKAYSFAHKLALSLTDRDGIDMKALKAKLTQPKKKRPPKPAKEPQTTPGSISGQMAWLM